jgi:phage terminase Nu1 subunit (DNA packaging protein)
VEFKDFDLDEIVKRYPLAKSVPDEVVTKKQLANAFGHSTNTIDKWVEQGLPILNEGGNGQAYEFQLSHCWAWYHAKQDAEKNRSSAAENAVRAMQLELTGGSVGEGINALSPKEKQEVITTQMAYEQFQRQRGELVERDEVVALLDTVFVLVRDTITTLPDRLERECDLDGNTVERAVMICDEMLSDAQSKISDFVEQNDNKGAPVRQNLFDA